MKPQFGEDAYSHHRQRANKIRENFDGGTISSITEKYIDWGYWTPYELRQKATSACRAEVREALNVLDENGTPFAGPTQENEEGAPVWRQMRFWSYADHVANAEAYWARGGSNLKVGNSIAVQCRIRFGHAPSRKLIVDEEVST